MKVENVVIIGAGPAGIAAALQFHRYGINPIILEKDKIGGLLRNADLVENYPGFPDGISGKDLALLFTTQLQNTVDVIFEEVICLDFHEGLFLIETPERTFHSRLVLVGSGTRAREFSDIEIPENAKRKVFYEIHPILEEKGRRVIIVGAGDAAFDYALNLGHHNDITVLNRGDNESCLPLLRERAERSPAISYHKQTEISMIDGDSSGKLMIECKSPEGTLRFDADYLIFATGREPQLDFLSGNLKDNAGELEDRGLLYFAGDVKNGIFRQTSIAAGQGVMAAMKMFKKITELSP
ncbi:MAG: NAD(P)/FAD-dependent oxidoreductase [candidate division Zixibacteria bacterium]